MDDHTNGHAPDLAHPTPPESETSLPRAAQNRLVGLDAIRLVCAAVVMMSHYGPQLAGNLSFLGTPLAGLLASVIGLAFNGPAAVIVFFVLSGFVIHLPYHEGKRMILSEYYGRRYLRIVPPALISMIFYFMLDIVPPGNDWNKTILWSVLCELVYYTLYPLVWRFRAQMGWMVRITFVTAFAYALYHRDMLAASNQYTIFGSWTWIVGLPCWLFGCWAATRFRSVPSIGIAALWSVRLAILVMSMILLVVRFHMPMLGMWNSNVITLNLFTFPVVVWICLEAKRGLAGYSHNPFGRVLDRMGSASYTLYLIHPLVLDVVFKLVPGQDLPGLIVYSVATAIATYLFYSTVERPSHIAARTVGRQATQAWRKRHPAAAAG